MRRWWRLPNTTPSWVTGRKPSLQWPWSILNEILALMRLIKHWSSRWLLGHKDRQWLFWDDNLSLLETHLFKSTSLFDIDVYSTTRFPISKKASESNEDDYSKGMNLSGYHAVSFCVLRIRTSTARPFQREMSTLRLAWSLVASTWWLAKEISESWALRRLMVRFVFFSVS